MSPLPLYKRQLTTSSLLTGTAKLELPAAAICSNLLVNLCAKMGKRRRRRQEKQLLCNGYISTCFLLAPGTED
ncbi:hypothetical protein M513_06716 [Trichuris suis]|uniref:Uncharacterized protein n=1 Tax=Trichuris suis TaxID=68888 RepID=A0A085M539_9BILA|nr:hypothetical protein M513_06716 [Trichuris suis]